MVLLKIAAISLIVGATVVAVNVATPILINWLSFKLRKKQVEEVMGLQRVYDAAF